MSPEFFPGRRKWLSSSTRFPVSPLSAPLFPHSRRRLRDASTSRASGEKPRCAEKNTAALRLDLTLIRAKRDIRARDTGALAAILPAVNRTAR